MKNRIVFIFILFSSVWLGLMLRAGYLQVLPNEKLNKISNRQYNSKVTLRSQRGTILDRNDRELAVSVTSYSLFVDPSLIKGSYRTSKQLASILKISRRKIQEKLKQKNKRFVWVKRFLDIETKNKIQKLKNKALGFIEEPKRIYPNNHMLSQTLGFVGNDGLGLEGIERSLDKYLKGSNKTIRMQRDARGRPLLLEDDMFNPPPNGADVNLTVDFEFQYMLERELINTVYKLKAESAVGVILDAQTSEILALANVPTYNLNSPFSYSPKYRRNRVVSDSFEQGSTVKTLTIAAALEEKAVKPNTEINCEGGTFKIGRRTINEADANHRFDKLTVSEVLAHSSNIGTSKIAFKLGDKKLREYFKKFGFGEKLNSGLPGEGRGILQKLPWSKHLLANTSFGHGITATPLQMASLYAAIANGGILKIPRIVKKVSDDSFDIEEAGNKRIMSEEVAKIMRLMLTGVTSVGAGGSRARVPGYQVAGKTGTAQKVDFNNGGYLKNQYISSFSGFVPSYNPRFVIYIAVDNPQGKIYGSQVAAPIFSNVAGYLLRKEGVEPILISKRNVMGSINPFEKKKKTKTRSRTLNVKNVGKLDIVPELTGLSLREVVKILKEQNIKVQAKGYGVVVGSEPESGELMPEKRNIKLILEPSH